MSASRYAGVRYSGYLALTGAGKTTTLSMLATLVECTSGDGYVDGHSIKADPAKVRRSIGMVFQDPSSDDLLSGRATSTCTH